MVGQDSISLNEWISLGAISDPQLNYLRPPRYTASCRGKLQQGQLDCHTAVRPQMTTWVPATKKIGWAVLQYRVRAGEADRG